MTMSPKSIYEILLKEFGYQHWWPVDRNYHKNQNSDPRFEIMVGAILTQNTAWANVEKALNNLKKQKLLQVHSLALIDEKTLKTMIQPSGFFNQKARRLKLFASSLYNRYRDDLNQFFSRDGFEIRQELLSVQGIGPETADSILLYAGNHPMFVVDAYTKRICRRIPFHICNDSYNSIQRYFEYELRQTIPKKDLVSTYKEFHALLVELAKRYCRKKAPLCTTCPLNHLCKKHL